MKTWGIVLLALILAGCASDKKDDNKALLRNLAINW